MFSALPVLPRCSPATPALAQSKINVVATFSILGDLVTNVGGDRIEVVALVGPNSDTHVFSPTPADAKKLAAAKVVFVNGLGLEGWMTRLVSASGTKAHDLRRQHRHQAAQDGGRSSPGPDR